MRFIKKLPDVADLRYEFGLNETQNKARHAKIEEIKSVLRGECKKKIILLN